MTDSFVTQCPHCQTSFRVTHHQLSVARGVVRCGHCLQVFNAAKQLLEQNRAASAAPAPAAAPAAPAAPALPDAEAATPAPPEAASSAPTPAPGEDWAVTAEALDALDLDKELERLERRGGRRRHAPPGRMTGCKRGAMRSMPMSLWTTCSARQPMTPSSRHCRHSLRQCC